MRMIKSTEEIELIKNAAQIADIGGQAVVDTLQEGVPEHEVALASTQTMVREIAKRYPHTDIMDSRIIYFLLEKKVEMFSRITINVELQPMYLTLVLVLSFT